MCFVILVPNIDRFAVSTHWRPGSCSIAVIPGNKYTTTDWYKFNPKPGGCLNNPVIWIQLPEIYQYFYQTAQLNNSLTFHHLTATPYLGHLGVIVSGKKI